MLPEFYELSKSMNIQSNTNDIKTLKSKSNLNDYSLSLMPQSEININTYISLFSIVGYYGGHYFNYSKRGEKWYLFDDHNYRKIGDFTKLMEQMSR